MAFHKLNQGSGEKVFIPTCSTHGGYKLVWYFGPACFNFLAEPHYEACYVPACEGVVRCQRGNGQKVIIGFKFVLPIAATSESHYHFPATLN